MPSSKQKRVKEQRAKAETAAAAELVAAARALELREKAQAGTPKEVTKETHYGLHESITCDGCCIAPIRGYRFKCRNCDNHDLCEECYTLHAEKGKIKHENKLAELKGGSASDHSFYCFVEPKIFRPEADVLAREARRAEIEAAVAASKSAAVSTTVAE